MEGVERIWEDAAVEVHRLVVGPVENNVYVVRCRRTGDALLIDAANEHDRLLEVCQALGVRSIVETHGHWDHVQAVGAVRDAGYEVAVRAEDAGMLESYDLLLGGRRRPRGRPAPRADRPHPWAHAGLHLLRGRGHTAASSAATPSSPAARATPRPTSATSRSSSDRSPTRIYAAYPDETIVLPGPRGDDDDRRRAPAPRRVGRAGLVARPVTGAGRGSTRSSVCSSAPSSTAHLLREPVVAQHLVERRHRRERVGDELVVEVLVAADRSREVPGVHEQVVDDDAAHELLERHRPERARPRRSPASTGSATFARRSATARSKRTTSPAARSSWTGAPTKS